MADMVNHPPHYSVFPEGFTAECIEYARLLGFAQGNAFKYIYRAGAKGYWQEDLDKAMFCLNDLSESGLYANTAHTFLHAPAIHSGASLRAMAGKAVLYSTDETIHLAMGAVSVFYDSLKETA